MSKQTYPVHVYLNWTSSGIAVQYRDAQGNLSPVYCDDIAVEGHPERWYSLAPQENSLADERHGQS